MTKNLYKVPSKAWRGWNAMARAVFNRVYDFSMENFSLMSHPKMERPKPAHWKTLSWNAAWIAADAVMDDIPTVVRDIDPKTGDVVRTVVAKTKLKAT
jgi:hypothetical protein